MSTITWNIPDRPQPYSFLLKEDTFFLLLETGGRIIIGETDWTDRTVIAEPDWANRTVIEVELDGNY